jgi:hypothetical protein
MNDGGSIDVRIATGRQDDEDGGIAQGGLLRRFAEAILDRECNLESARAACISSLGEDATIQAASIVASFDGINRVADATGIRLDPETEGSGRANLIAALEYEALGAARS